MTTVLRAFAFSLLALPTSLLAWADDGHNAIWIVAQSRLTPAAKAAVDSIIGNDKPGLTAVWMDRARDADRGKGGDLEHDEEAAAFNKKFKYNASWHYVDLPLGTPSYAAAAAFNPHDNVVTMIRKTMEVLEGKSTKMDKRMALRVLVHLVGDIHQPLHCASGFYDVSDPQHPVLHTDVESCLKLDQDHCSDLGGNLIFFGTGTYDQLHALWDVDAVKRVGLLTSLPGVIEKHVASVNASTEGARQDWSEKWAAESVRQASKAYGGIEFGACTLNTDPNKRGKLTRIEIKLPEDYNERAKTITLDQMTKAAIRLADVLNDIFK